MIIKAYKNSEEFDIKLLNTRGFKYQGIRVDYKCDKCNEIKNVDYKSLLKYGYDTEQYCRSCSIKNNNSVEKRKQTCINKYGSDNPMKVPEFANKRDVESIAEKQRNDFENIKQSFKENNYILLSETYENRNKKLSYICSEGHKGTITLASWSKGCRCNTCGNIKSTDKKRHTLEFVKGTLAIEGYELLSNSYKSNKIPIKYKCPLGHIGTTRFDGWLYSNVRCSSCSHIVSKSELEVYEIIKKYFPDTIHNDRDLIKPLELDIFIPSKNTAIEYCGLFWHSELHGKDRNYHINKLEECNKKNIKLITIFEDEWFNRKEVVISRLLHILGVSENDRIYARNCKVREITSGEARDFCEINHLQGYFNTPINIGAFYNDKLVSVMTFAKSSIAKGGKSGLELSRFCSDYRYNVIGIAGKLFNYFVTNYDCDEIISYSDKRWSIGNIYKILGFNFVHESPPNYWYIDNMRRIHRFNFRKNILHKKLEYFDNSISEWKNMQNNKYDRIWDCGNTKWIYSK